MWGSFLNVVAYRLIQGLNIIYPRSFCPHCTNQLAWHDLIPLVSFLLLAGRCRTCKKHISWLYPSIEGLTVISLLLLCSFISQQFLFGYFLFFSALIVTIRTDLETMLISRYVTLYAIPLGWCLSYFQLIPLGLAASIAGTILGYGILWTIVTLFWWITGKEGMGQGDLELLAFIGSCTGIAGCWVTLLIASITGSLIGIILLHLTKQSRDTQIPFGPFLAFGAMVFVIGQEYGWYVLERLLL